jgi:AcrR family transcriptional regulator
MPKRNTYQREERILNAVASLIARLGYDKTTVSDIAAEAGVAKGAVYLHWESKEALFDALIVREMQKLLRDLLERVERDAQGGSLTRMYRHALLAMQANPLMRALYTQDSRVLGAYIHRQNASRYLERYWFGKAFIEYMQSAGLVREDLNPVSLAYLLTILAYGFASIETLIPADQAPPLDEVADALDGLLAHGIALEGGDMEAGKQAMRLAIAEINRQYAALSMNADKELT